MSELMFIDDPHQDMLDADPFPPGSALSTIWRQNKMRASGAVLRWKAVSWFEETLSFTWNREEGSDSWRDLYQQRPLPSRMEKEISPLEFARADLERYMRVDREIMKVFRLKDRSDVD